MLNYRFAKLYHFFHTQWISVIVVCLKKYFFGIQKNVLPLRHNFFETLTVLVRWVSG